MHFSFEVLEYILTAKNHYPYSDEPIAAPRSRIHWSLHNEISSLAIQSLSFEAREMEEQESDKDYTRLW